MAKKWDRMEVRPTRAEKAIITQAADKEVMSVSRFICQAGIEKARRVLGIKEPAK